MWIVRAALLVLLAGQDAGAASRLDPGATGRFLVGDTTITLVDAARARTLVTEVWYPAAIAARDAPSARGRFPLVLVAHGNCGFRTNYEFLTRHLASRGFVVAAPEFPGFNKALCDAGGPTFGHTDGPPDDLAFLARALRDPAGPAAAIARAVAGRKTGLVGHSLGGLAVINAAVAHRALGAVVVLAPLAAAGTAAPFHGLAPARNVLVVAGTADTTLPPAFTAVPFFAALPPPAWLVTIAGGTHGGFTDVAAGMPAAALARQQALTNRYATAFLEGVFARRRRMRRFLTPADAAGQGGDVTMAAR
jgi:predicted dienelactone hydrolase